MKLSQLNKKKKKQPSNKKTPQCTIKKTFFPLKKKIPTQEITKA